PLPAAGPISQRGCARTTSPGERWRWGRVDSRPWHLASCSAGSTPAPPTGPPDRLPCRFRPDPSRPPSPSGGHWPRIPGWPTQRRAGRPDREGGARERPASGGGANRRRRSRGAGAWAGGIEGGGAGPDSNGEGVSSGLGSGVNVGRFIEAIEERVLADVE